MFQRFAAITLLFSMFIDSCTERKPTAEYQPGSFGYDLQFLQKHDSVIMLQEGESRVIVSPKYQAKVFTSSAAGEAGTSFGWIHYKAFDGPVDLHMNAYGGENRLWLGPEGGKFSLFFPPGDKMEFTNWKTPAAFDTEPWEVTGRELSAVTLKKDAQLTNYAGTRLNLSITRKISIYSKNEIDRVLSLNNDDSIKAGVNSGSILPGRNL